MIYLYRCTACNSQFELQMTIKEKESLSRVVCPRCSNEKVVQIITPPVVRFIGKGFYTNDSKGTTNE